MKFSYTLNLLLAIALVILSLKITFGTPKEKNKTDDNTQSGAIENIMTRTSIRNYTDKPIEKEKLETILKAGMAAPSAGNKQPWHFVVIDDKETLTAIADQIKPAGPVGRSSATIIACGDLNNTFEGEGAYYWVQDVSAVSENILLAAHALDLGAVWCGIYPISNRVEYVQNLLNLPENIVPLSAIALGYPDEDPMPKDKWNPELIHNNKW